MQTTDKKILVIEDNKYSMDKICNILKDITDIIILKAETSGTAYCYANEYDIDLFIIDIILDSSKAGDISGINFAESMRDTEKYEFTPMIFTTSLEDPKLYAYAQLHCYQYFEKPYDDEEFKSAILKNLKRTSVKKEREIYKIKTDGMFIPIQTKDIVYFEVKPPTETLVCCSDGDKIIAPYKSTKQILLELNSNKFLKCNNRIIVNRNYIKTIGENNHIVELKNEFGKFRIGLRLYKGFIDGIDE